MRRKINKAIHDPDHYVIVLDYLDKYGRASRRVVSPIRFAATNRFLALCLCREEPRTFQMERVTNVHLAPAHEFVMPVPMQVV